MVDFVALCGEGLEDTLLGEISQLGKVSDIDIFSGAIIFSFDGEIARLKELKTAEDILIFLNEFSDIRRYKASLRSIRQQTAKVDVKKAISILKDTREIGNTFSVKATYVGRRDYNASEIAEAASIGIHNADDTLSNAEYGKLLFRVVLTPEISFIGLSLEDVPLDEKNKVMTVPGSLRPSIANILLKLAEIKKGDVLLDPMCGTGIIAIEGINYGAESIAGDIDEEKIRLAKKNAAIRNPGCKFYVWDARDTELSPGLIDKVVSNLPFEKQANIIGFDESFFDDFLKEMVRVSKESAIFVFLTKHEEIITRAAGKNNLEIISAIEIKNSGLSSTIITIKKSKKLSEANLHQLVNSFLVITCVLKLFYDILFFQAIFFQLLHIC